MSLAVALLRTPTRNLLKTNNLFETRGLLLADDLVAPVSSALMADGASGDVDSVLFRELH